MNIDFSKIVSANELAVDTQKILDKLSGQDELLVFDDNKPQFAIVSLEQYDKLQSQSGNCNNDVTGRNNESAAEKKIGVLVRETFKELIDRDMLTMGEIHRLCDPWYSKETFGLTYAVLK